VKKEKGESSMYPTKCACHFVMSLVLVSILGLLSSCVATRKYVRSEVRSSEDELNARIDKTDNNFKEMNDRVGDLDSRTNEHGRRLDSMNSDLQKTSADLRKTSDRTSEAQSAAENAQSNADQARSRVVILEGKFQNRNQYTVVAEKSVLFQFDSWNLDRTYQSVLNEVTEIVGQNPDALILLEGRTDSKGKETYNIQLGERRAEAVKRYLVVEKYVPMYRIHQMSFGSARPIADNGSREGREKNRTVVVSVLVPRSGSAAGSNAAK
jgi:outer membrane protein OmpA-like peptidoglycan-associated protein